MTHHAPRPLSALVFCLALGLPAQVAQPAPAPRRIAPEVMRFHRSQEPVRAQLARECLLDLRPQLGLGAREDFRVAGTFTNPSGEAIVRLDHQYEGFRVLGSGAMARVPYGGNIRSVTRGVLPGVQVQGTPRLSPEQAVNVALRHFAPKGPLRVTPTVERVVFPAQCLGGTVMAVDPARGSMAPDPERSVHARLAEPYVWAYEVHASVRNPQDGLKAVTYHVDARTGAILRIQDEIRRQAAPATGTGKGLWCGTVSLPTSRLADGSFALYDPTRGSRPAPYLAENFQPDGSGWSPTGMQVWYDQHDAAGTSTWMAYLFQGNPENTWGDGQPFREWGAESATNGQTAGVDALYGMSRTWDFYQQVFNRDGMDGKGTSVFAEVLLTDPYFIDNASMYPRMSGILLGAGSYPVNPGGLLPPTELDVLAHEMTHAFTYSTASFINAPGFEEAGLDEGTADFFAQMVKAWVNRPEGAPDNVIPNTGTDWTVGTGCNHGKPLRWMDKPSRDGRSVDAWYDGLHYMDGHFSSGVLARALYFLAQGASATPGDDHYSPYLPKGMAGIGNDKAAHIWYSTVGERLYNGGKGTLTLEDARREAVAAARYLYGPGGWDCPESIAVENAFAAVNVGSAYAEAPRTRVAFTAWRNHDWIERNHFPDSFWPRSQYFPMGTEVWPKVTVTNNTNQEVTWSVGGPSVLNDGLALGMPGFALAGGIITPAGAWKTPNNSLAWFAITATSKADPRQFAEGRAFVVNLDTDSDNDQDAVDLGNIAFSWYLTNALTPAHSVFNRPMVDDEEVAAFADAMRNAWWRDK